MKSNRDPLVLSSSKYERGESRQSRTEKGFSNADRSFRFRDDVRNRQLGRVTQGQGDPPDAERFGTCRGASTEPHTGRPVGGMRTRAPSTNSHLSLSAEAMNSSSAVIAGVRDASAMRQRYPLAAACVNVA